MLSLRVAAQGLSGGNGVDSGKMHQMSSIACESAVSDVARQMLIIVLFYLAWDKASGCLALQNLSHAVFRVTLLIWP